MDKPDTYHRQQRAAIVLAVVYPFFVAAVMFGVLVPLISGVLEA